MRSYTVHSVGAQPERDFGEGGGPGSRRGCTNLQLVVAVLLNQLRSSAARSQSISDMQPIVAPRLRSATLELNSASL